MGARVAVLALLVPFLTPLAASPASAAGQTVVSLEFDDGSASQYTLAYQKALQPHGDTATFFVKSGTVGNTGNMTWPQVTSLAAAGNDIGGKTVNSANLTTDPNPTAQVCNDRQALIQHGITPVAFAYPGGAYNSSVQTVVKNCGYGNGRGAGGVSASGPAYAETIPPANSFATRAWTPPTPASAETQLSDMQAEVSAAAAHGGGWVQIILNRVCSQTYDPNNYTSCVGSSRPVELDAVNGFLDWMQNAGQAGGAPAGATLNTARNVITGSDTTAPATTIACNGAACQPSTYTGSVSVTLSATDTGSGIASTHYTTDGTTPTLSSPTYTGPFLVASTATVKYASWDNAGNAETAHSQTITVQQQSADTTPPTTTISCNGAPCSSTPYTAPVTVTLNATDNPGGYGVDKTYYTTDGSTPTTSSTVYTGPFTVKQNATVKFFSTDLAGNAEQVNTQTINFKVIVSLTFDDGDESQYDVGYLHGLQPLGMQGTFYIVSNWIGNPSSGNDSMTWSQVSDLYNHGNDVGGHTADHIDLASSSYTQAQKTAEVCDNFQALTQHGVDPVSFAYPYGSYDANAEQIVQSCGFSDGRTTGGLDNNGTGAGPVYAETIPPKNPYTLRAVYNSTPGAQITLSYLENSVTAAAQNGGGWAPFTFHKICSQTYDPANYSSCISDTASPTELDTFTAFLSWLQNAGQPGGAPAGTVVKTVRQVANGPDTTPPATTLTCDGSPCQASTYNGSTTVNLSAADKGGAGVAATYYTTDGSTPTTSSPTWNGYPYTITSTTTFKFFSVDNAGNTEPVETTTVQVQPNADPVIGAAGDIACDPSSPAFNNGQGTGNVCREASTANLLTGMDAVLPLGDDQYDCGGLSAFQQSYAPTWGVKKSITYPVPGDHDLLTSGGTDCPSALGAYYQQYFSSSGGWYGSPVPSAVNVDPNVGYYSYNLGSWHIIALNTGMCEVQQDNGQPASFCAAGSAQDQWLQNDLAHDTAACTLAYMQDPRWASNPSGDGGDSTYQQLWQDLNNGGTDVVLAGNDHWYERFAPLNASGQIDNTHGTREFIVGTGGQGLEQPGAEVSASQVLDNTTHGILKLTLHNGSYDWQFLNDGESSFTDSGTAGCHDAVAPTTNISVNGGAPSAGWYNAPVSVSLSATDNSGGSGVDKTYYTTDGSTPTTSSTVYTGPFTVSATSTVKFFSTDKAGNAESVESQLIQIDTTPPATAISCNGAACATGWFKTAPVTVALSATDTGGSGTGFTVYTTDGSNPASSPTSMVYTVPFSVSQTATVKFYSVDNAGNAEAVKSQPIQIDTTAPSTAISCNGAACLSWYKANVNVTLSATDTGSGLSKTYYTTDGSTPTTSSKVYTGAFALSATATVKFFSVDNAGNAEAVKSQLIGIDKTAPSAGSISCNSAACSSAWYKTSPVTVTLSAADNAGGSGIAATFYTTDGSNPQTSKTALVYTGPFGVSQTTTVEYYSVDNAGNSNAVKSQTIKVDAAAPAVSISSPANGSTFRQGTTVTITASATDLASGSGAPSGIANVTFYVDGVAKATVGKSPYSFRWATVGVTKGTHTLTAVATDVAGNSTTSAPITVTIN